MGLEDLAMLFSNLPQVIYAVVAGLVALFVLWTLLPLIVKDFLQILLYGILFSAGIILAVLLVLKSYVLKPKPPETKETIVIIRH